MVNNNLTTTQVLKYMLVPKGYIHTQLKLPFSTNSEFLTSKINSEKKLLCNIH